MKAMNKMARAVSAEYAGVDGWELVISRGWRPDSDSRLSEETIAALQEWVTLLDRVICSELDYEIEFYPDGYSATVCLQNGPMFGGGQEFPLDLDVDDHRDFAAFDWHGLADDLRKLTEAMETSMGGASGPVPKWFKDYLASGGKP